MKKLTTKEIQNLELAILRAFDRFAKEEHLRWYLAGGTLIGAVRHQGFIPWDDDIDIMMPREDYEKMLKTFRHERYRLSECRNNPEAAIPFAQIYDSQTFLKWKKVKDPDLGVFIDIFPIDGYPENEFAAKIHTRCLWLLRFMNNIARKKLLRGEKYMVLKRILMLLFRKSPNAYAIRINRLGMKYPFRSSRFVGVTGTTDHLFKERNLKEAVFAEPDPLLLPFEDLMLPCPPGYDVYLTHLFGNYMQLPPEEKQVSVHSFTAYEK